MIRMAEIAAGGMTTTGGGASLGGCDLGQKGTHRGQRDHTILLPPPC
jgi:hypothetical protein